MVVGLTGALAEEMKSFKSARVLNQKAAEGLDATCEALKATTKAIQPFTELRVRRLSWLLVSSAVLNVLLFIAVLLVLLLKK